MALVRSAVRDIDILSGVVLDAIVVDDELRQVYKLRGGMRLKILMILIVLAGGRREELLFNVGVVPE